MLSSPAAEQGKHAGLDTAKRKDGGALARTLSSAARAELLITHASKHDLNMLVDNRPHQARTSQRSRRQLPAHVL